MFYVYELPKDSGDQAIRVTDIVADEPVLSSPVSSQKHYDGDDIDFVDDALLNTAPHNVIEQQLLRGDVVGLALMSGAIIWSAMGAFG
jgi:hypothetical protein